jgi:hypothetical protein
VTELPIDYRERAGETTLDPIAGGAAIAASILRVGVQERLRRVREGGARPDDAGA